MLHDAIDGEELHMEPAQLGWRAVRRGGELRRAAAPNSQWLRRMLAARPLALLLLISCAQQSVGDMESGDVELPAELGASAFGDSVVRDVARIRDATAEFRSLDAAVLAGYARDVTHCVDNLPAGAMGFHHQNDQLLDDRIEIERPEMLVYERLPDGEYRLNGVEYIVPLDIWPATREPPVVMGQQLKPAPALGIWYRHVWVWRENPSGLFADWNPLVKC